MFVYLFSVHPGRCFLNSSYARIQHFGPDMPEECRAGLSEKQLETIWVHGVYHAPASVISRANGGWRVAKG